MDNIEIGYAAEHEQWPPNILQEHVMWSERAGFDFAWTSDHFHPWAHTNASSGFAWFWLGSVAANTKKIQLGTSVTCPSFRYHPGVIAQAFATMDNMYPGRFSLGLGTGEAMNEIPLGFDWPNMQERIERLSEAIQLIRSLWEKNWVTFRGNYFRLNKANLYTRPTSKIPIMIATSGPKVAEVAGKYADGIITIRFEKDYFDSVLFKALAKGAKESGRDPSSLHKAIELWVSYDEDHDRALQSTRFWAAQMLPFIFKYAVSDPREIESYGQLVGDSQISKYWCIGTSADEHISFIEKFARMGFDKIYILSSSPDQKKTIEMYGKNVIPYFRNR